MSRLPSATLAMALWLTPLVIVLLRPCVANANSVDLQTRLSRALLFRPIIDLFPGTRHRRDLAALHKSRIFTVYDYAAQPAVLGQSGIKIHDKGGKLDALLEANGLAEQPALTAAVNRAARALVAHSGKVALCDWLAKGGAGSRSPSREEGQQALDRKAPPEGASGRILMMRPELPLLLDSPLDKLALAYLQSHTLAMDKQGQFSPEAADQMKDALATLQKWHVFTKFDLAMHSIQTLEGLGLPAEVGGPLGLVLSQHTEGEARLNMEPPIAPATRWRKVNVSKEVLQSPLAQEPNAMREIERIAHVDVTELLNRLGIATVGDMADGLRSNALSRAGLTLREFEALQAGARATGITYETTPPKREP